MNDSSIVCYSVQSYQIFNRKHVVILSFQRHFCSKSELTLEKETCCSKKLKTMAVEVYLDFSKKFLEKSKNCPEELKSVYYDESTLLLLKALKCADKPDVQKYVKKQILNNFCNNSKNIQDQICQMTDEPVDNTISKPPPKQPSANSNDIDASVEHCKVTKFVRVKWSDIVINSSVKKNIMQDVIEPLKLYRGRLQGVMPGHLLGKQC